jgi:SAM-dependent methyltransferase
MANRFDPRRWLRRSSKGTDAGRQRNENGAECSGVNDPGIRVVKSVSASLVPPLEPASVFRTEIVDLGSASNPEFAGIITPLPELSATKTGVDSVFLENAEAYYAKYQGFDYWKMLIEQAAQKLALTDPRLIVEFGCGFGNSTLPLLDLFPDAQLVATDISPNLLAILHRLLAARGQGARCVVAAMDAQKPYLHYGIADLVVGSAILHHLAEPDVFIRRAMDVLKPGGAAIFFEPFEAGNAVLRLICLEVEAEAKRRKVKSNRAVNWLAKIPEQLAPQIFRERRPHWRDRNDKWAFPKSVLERFARENGADLLIYPIHDNRGQFTRHFSYMMDVYAGIPKSELPDWAWKIFDRFDNEIFSPEMLTDLLLEGCIIFRKQHQPAATERENAVDPIMPEARATR